MMVAMGRGKRKETLLFSVNKASVIQDEKVSRDPLYCNTVLNKVKIRCTKWPKQCRHI
jgi:hypothetical protein